jgi:hypothetical protein
MYFSLLLSIFVVSAKCIDPWVLEFVVSNSTRQQSMRKLYFVGFQCSWFKWTTKSTKIRTLRLIMISQYIKDMDDWLIDFWCLTPLSAISWRPVLVVEETGVPGENHRPWETTGKLYHLRLRVEWTLFVIYKAGRDPTPHWW